MNKTERPIACSSAPIDSRTTILSRSPALQVHPSISAKNPQLERRICRNGGRLTVLRGHHKDRVHPVNSAPVLDRIQQFVSIDLAEFRAERRPFAVHDDSRQGVARPANRL